MPNITTVSDPIDQRERFALERRYKALGRLEGRELRSLETAVRRQVQEMETARELKAETMEDRIEVIWSIARDGSLADVYVSNHRALLIAVNGGQRCSLLGIETCWSFRQRTQHPPAVSFGSP
jgi:hypothetical protein